MKVTELPLADKVGAGFAIISTTVLQAMLFAGVMSLQCPVIDQEKFSSLMKVFILAFGSTGVYLFKTYELRRRDGNGNGTEE